MDCHYCFYLIWEFYFNYRRPNLVEALTKTVPTLRRLSLQFTVQVHCVLIASREKHQGVFKNRATISYSSNRLCNSFELKKLKCVWACTVTLVAVTQYTSPQVSHVSLTDPTYQQNTVHKRCNLKNINVQLTLLAITMETIFYCVSIMWNME